MLRRLLLAVLFTSFSAVSAFAFDIDDMSDEERKAFGDAVREYLISNPDVFLEVVAILEQRRENEAARAELALVANNREAIFNDGYSYVGGNPDGDVTIVEFLDYRCGFCQRAFPAVEELLSSDGNIKIIVKEYPILGEASVQASRYAIATLKTEGGEAYKSVHDRLMTLRGEPNEVAFERLSSELGLDHDAIVAEMNSDEVSNVIEANYELARNLQIQGTPSFVMGERLVRGFVELEQMREIVAEIREGQG